jgi:hypothetical protein
VLRRLYPYQALNQLAFSRTWPSADDLPAISVGSEGFYAVVSRPGLGGELLLADMSASEAVAVHELPADLVHVAVAHGVRVIQPDPEFGAPLQVLRLVSPVCGHFIGRVTRLPRAMGEGRDSLHGKRFRPASVPTEAPRVGPLWLFGVPVRDGLGASGVIPRSRHSGLVA